jgi:glycosyltransferase involved in cell wall biosynthesis
MSISVLHAPAWYPPYSIGGTETYVSSLVRALSRRGVQSAIAIPRPAGAPEQYEHDGVRVFTYPVSDEPTRGELRGIDPPSEIGAFESLLPGFDVYHQHAISRGCSAHHLSTARRSGLKTIFTAHVPGAVCIRGTMLEYGTTPCDGKVSSGRCATCWAHKMGVPLTLAQLVGSVPEVMSVLVERATVFGRGATLAGARAGASRKLAEIRTIGNEADRIVAVCQWLFDALATNGVPLKKLSLLRQGLDPDLAEALARRERASSSVFRFGFIGRWSAVKGIHVIVEAFGRLPRQVNASLSIHAAGADEEADRYRSYVELLAARDDRIHIEQAIGQDLLSETLSRIDALLVPSQGLETGPMVVLEAQAAGVPVIGSNIGGIAELATIGGGVTTVPMADVDAWSSALHAFATRPESHLIVPRCMSTMDTVADDMIRLYQSNPARQVA